jgi:predicted nuclease of predicted toxin-antitoxin system
LRFLIHGNLNPAVKTAIERHGHTAQSREEAGIDASLEAAEVLQAAHQKQMDIMTNDRDLALFARSTSLKFDRAIVYLQLGGAEIEQDDAIDRLFDRYKAPKPRMMYTVTETRVKVQQLKSS